MVGLSKKIGLTVNGFNISLSSPIQLYVRDSLRLIFTVNEYGIDINQRIKTARLLPIEPLRSKLYIETPNGTDTIEDTEIVGNEITFELLPNHTAIAGIYKLQLVLFADNGNKITLPEFTYEVKKSINQDADNGLLEDEEVITINALATNDNEILVTDNGNILVI